MASARPAIKPKATSKASATGHEARSTLAALRRLVAASSSRAAAARAVGVSAPTLKRYLDAGVPARLRKQPDRLHALLGTAREAATVAAVQHKHQRATLAQQRRETERDKLRTRRSRDKERKKAQAAKERQKAKAKAKPGRKKPTPAKPGRLAPHKKQAPPIGSKPLGAKATDSDKLQWQLSRLGLLLDSTDEVAAVFGITPGQAKRWEQSGPSNKLVKSPDVLAELVHRGGQRLAAMAKTAPDRRRVDAVLAASAEGVRGQREALRAVKAVVDAQNLEDKKCGFAPTGVKKAAAAMELHPATLRAWIKQGAVPAGAVTNALRYVADEQDEKLRRVQTRKDIVRMLGKARKLNRRDHVPPTVVEDFVGTRRSDQNVSRLWSKKVEQFLTCELVDEMLSFIDAVHIEKRRLRFPHWMATITCSGLERPGDGDGRLAPDYRTVIIELGSEEDTELQNYLNLNFPISSACQSNRKAMARVFRDKLLSAVRTGYEVFVWGLVVRNWRPQTEEYQAQRYQEYLGHMADRKAERRAELAKEKDKKRRRDATARRRTNKRR